MSKQKPPYQVRMSDELYALAQAKAKALGISFAAYVRLLIAKDSNDSVHVSHPLPEGQGLST
jgi:hypothetical protein